MTTKTKVFIGFVIAAALAASAYFTHPHVLNAIKNFTGTTVSKKPTDSVNSLLKRKNDTIAILQSQLAAAPNREEIRADAIREYELAAQARYDSQHYAPAKLKLTNAHFKIIGAQTSKFDISYGAYFANLDNYYEFELLPTWLLRYLNMNDQRDALTKRLENPWALNQLFQTLKPAVKHALDVSQLRKPVRKWANELLPYANGTANKKNVQLFTAYYALHSKDTSYGETHFNRDNQEWKNVEAQFANRELAINAFKEWLFVKRHSEAAELFGLTEAKKKAKGHGKQWLQVFSQILTFLKTA